MNCTATKAHITNFVNGCAITKLAPALASVKRDGRLALVLHHPFGATAQAPQTVEIDNLRHTLDSGAFRATFKVDGRSEGTFPYDQWFERFPRSVTRGRRQERNMKP